MMGTMAVAVFDCQGSAGQKSFWTSMTRRVSVVWMAMLIVLLSKGVPPSPYLGRKLFGCNDLMVGCRGRSR